MVYPDGITLKALFSGVSIAVTLLAYFPYVVAIARDQTRPHLFSWIIWSLVTYIVFFAQLDADGGVGAWPTLVAALLSTYITVLAYRHKADVHINGSDWLFFLSALMAIPFWYYCGDPLWAVVLVTLVDTLAFAPTLRKAYYYPHQEHLTFFALFILRNVFSVFALEAYSVTTLLFPVVISLACGGLIGLTLWRRRRLKFML